MNHKEFEAKLVKEFPNLYKDMHGSPTQTCMAWGINTGPGWFELIHQLSANLERMILAMPENERAEYKAFQVKEKWGTLRFNMCESTKEMDHTISEAEVASEHICQECGEGGELRSGPWIKVLCDGCYEKDKK